MINSKTKLIVVVGDAYQKEFKNNSALKYVLIKNHSLSISKIEDQLDSLCNNLHERLSHLQIDDINCLKVIRIVKFINDLTQENKGKNLKTTLYTFLLVVLSALEKKIPKINKKLLLIQNGLKRFEDIKIEVNDLKTNAESEKANAAVVKRRCEQFLADLVIKKKLVDEKSIILKEEQMSLQKLADLADLDLQKALPSLIEAQNALETINKRDISEIKTYAKPSVLIVKVLEAVMVLKGSDPTWDESKRQLGDPNFLNTLINFKSEEVTDKTLKKINSSYTCLPDFQPHIVGKVSEATKSLCQWVIAIENYCQIYRVVEPKRQRLRSALVKLETKKTALENSKAELESLEDKLRVLEQEYNQYINKSEEIKEKVIKFEKILAKANLVITGLSKEESGWINLKDKLEQKLKRAFGDSIIKSFAVCFQRDSEKTIFDQNLKNLINMVKNEKIYISSKTENEENLILKSSRDLTSKLKIIIKQEFVSLVYDPQKLLFEVAKTEIGMENLRKLSTGELFFDISLNKIIEDEDNSLPIFIEVNNLNRKVQLNLKKLVYHRKNSIKIIIYSENKLILDIFKTTEYCICFNFEPNLKQQQQYFINLIVESERRLIIEGKIRFEKDIKSIESRLSNLKNKILIIMINENYSLVENDEMVDILNQAQSLSAQLKDKQRMSERSFSKIHKYYDDYKELSEICSILYQSTQKMVEFSNFYAMSLKHVKILLFDAIKASNHLDRISDRSQIISDKLFANLASQLMTIYTNA